MTEKELTRIAPGTPSPYAVPPDAEAAHDAWGANCGPASIAALLGLSLEDVRPHLGDFEKRRYMNPTHAKESLQSLGAAFRLAEAHDRWPVTGLAFIQWNGTWNTRPVFEQYRHTHWIAVRGDWVYDVNADEWCPRWWWEQEVAPELAKATKGADGTWFVRTGYEVVEALAKCCRAVGREQA